MGGPSLVRAGETRHTFLWLRGFGGNFFELLWMVAISFPTAGAGSAADVLTAPPPA